MSDNKRISQPRRAVRFAFILQLLALSWELTWHLVLHPEAEGLGLNHILSIHAPFNLALLLTAGSGAWFAIHSLGASRVTPLTLVALGGIAIEVIGWAWDLIAHTSYAHGHGPQLTMLAGAALAVGALLLQDRKRSRSPSNHPLSQAL